MLKNNVYKMRLKYQFIILFSFLYTYCSFGQVSELDLQLAQKYYIDAEYEKAILYYNKIAKEPNYKLKIYNNYYSSFIELKQFKNAEKLCKDIIKDFPNKLSTVVDLGLLYGLDNKLDKKSQIFDKAIKQISDKTLYNDALDLGLAFEKIGDTDRALSTYLAFESSSKRNIFSFHEKTALLYNKKGEISKMINTFFEMLDQSDNFLTTVQNGLINSIDFQNNLKEKEILRKFIIKKIQSESQKTIYIELLSWFYMTNNDYENAFIQIKSLDKKLNKNGSKVLELGNISLNNKNYNIAVKSYQYVIENSSVLENKLEAKNKKLLAIKRKLLTGNFILVEELKELKSNYITTLSQLDISNNTFNNSIRKYNLLVDLSEIEAYYLDDVSAAKQHLNTAILIPRLKEKLKAEAKLKLADILVLEDNIWEASLKYLQIEKQFKDDQLGHLAKFKNAQVYYFSGEYDWCQSQLDVLKASTSKLIANDALELSVLISDNFNMDTSETAMKLFSYADMLSAQQQYSEAIILYDSVLNNFKNHSLNDEILFRKAKIHLKQNSYSQAINNLLEIEKKFPNSILLDNSLFLAGCIYQENIKDFDSAKKYFKTILFEHQGSLYTAEARKRFRKLAGSTNEKIIKNS
jgi:tetratricopeptide (TPR) repeat protein